MLNMRVESEMQSRLAANVCKLEHSVPSRSLESEPENVLNTRSPGRYSRWTPPDVLETPDRPTSSGLQSPVGAPVHLGLSPQTREYSHPSPCCIPPAQWGNMHARDTGEEEYEWFGNAPAVQEGNDMGTPSDGEANQDELDNAAALHASDSMAATLEGPRCVNGQLMRPTPPRDDSPSTACRPNFVNAPGGVALGRGPPGFGQSPVSDSSTSTMVMPFPVQPLIRENGQHRIRGPGSGVGDHSNPAGNPYPGEGLPGSMVQEEHNPQEEGIQVVIQAAAARFQVRRLHSSQEEQAIQVAARQPRFQDHLHPADILIHGLLWIDQENHCRSFHCPPTTRIAAF